MERLQKVIAAAGIASRRRAEDFVRAGRVCVNGQIVRKLGTKVDPQHDDIRVNGQRIGSPLSSIFIVLHKPVGYLTTCKDPQGRPTVMDLLGDRTLPVYPVGRLDRFSTGLVLLTNEGEVAYILTHPRYGVRKVYHVWTEYPVPPAEQRKLRKGVLLEDGIARAIHVHSLPGDPSGLEVILTEGRKREVRRMLAALGHRVIQLRRTALGPLEIGTLSPGQWRYLEAHEIDQLRKFVQERKLKIASRKSVRGRLLPITRPAPHDQT